jgi:hypothetical protein
MSAGMPSPAGTAFSVQDTTSTGGQLGQDDENDYWAPTRVERLRLSEAEARAQQEEAGGDLAWKVLQVMPIKQVPPGREPVSGCGSLPPAACLARPSCVHSFSMPPSDWLAAPAECKAQHN